MAKLDIPSSPALSDYRVVVYSTAFCGFCRAAQRLLRERQIDFQSVDVTLDRTARRWLRETTGRSTVPQIFIDGESIGGFVELSRLAEEGELDRLGLSTGGEA